MTHHRPRLTARLASVASPLLLALVAGGVCAPSVLADVKPSAGMLRWPDVSKDRIVFSYANDLWTVPKAGGVATPLASPPGQESFPRFSLDGATVAFVGNYDGNRDLYTMSVAGGVPFRVTHHPSGETLADWMGADRLMFTVSGMGGLTRASQLWSTPATGGMPSQLPVPYGGFGSVSPDGQWLAYTTHSTDTRTWKRYRGGMATDVWLFNLTTKQSRRITDWEGTDTLPMWIPGGKGDKVYYLSDQGPEHRLNIWSFDIATGARTQITRHRDNDVRWPSIGPGNNGEGEVVFQLGAELRLLNLGDNSDRAVEVTIPGDRPTLRPRLVDASRNMQGGSISPTGKRVVVGARGDLFTAPAERGVTRNLTRSSGFFERDPAWSPDGRWIAYFSDESGEYELWVRPSDARPAKDEKKDDKKDEKKPEGDAGAAATQPDADEEAATPASAGPRKLTSLGAGFRYSPTWSPDSKHIVFHEENGNILLTTLETGETKVIDTDPWAEQQPVSWSHNSEWLAYAKGDANKPQSGIWLYNTRTGAKQQVVSAFFDCGLPVFDRKGDYLYFRSNREVDNPIYGDLDTTFVYTQTARLFAVPLRNDVKNPMLAKSDEEEYKPEAKKPEEKKPEEKKPEEKKPEGADGKPAEAKPGDAAPMGGDEAKAASEPAAEGEKKEEPKKDADKKDDFKPLTIDLEGFERRAMALPIEPGSFGAMAVNDKNALMFVRFPTPRAGAQASVRIVDIHADEVKEEQVVGETGSFELSADGKKILFGRGGAMLVGDAKTGGGKPTTVPTDSMRTTVNVREEWAQILRDTYRLQRDFFYESGLHGVDWQKVYNHYNAMLPDVVTREDVAWIQAEMISELNIGHAYLSNPGDVESAPSLGVGLLGVDFELATQDGATAYRIARIYEGAAWDSDARGPLSQPGVDVKVGDFVLAVNGVPLDTARDPWASFLAMADRTVTLTVSAKPTHDDSAREVTVRTIGSETGLRYRAWVEGRRAHVEQRSNGQVGYIYVPNTGVDGQDELFRQFFGQRHKAALIIDDRWNGGGQIPTRFIELLNRPVTNYWARRNGNDWTWPPDSHQGPKAMLINGLAGSGGDMFPWLFKRNNLGPLIGTRTWGGLVGISGNPGLIDGGAISVPTFGFYETDGTWGVEGHGVDPDIEVIDDPALMQNGGDPQLDRAIDEMLKAIQERGYKKPARPAGPNRSGMGLDPRDK